MADGLQFVTGKRALVAFGPALFKLPGIFAFALACASRSDSINTCSEMWCAARPGDRPLFEQRLIQTNVKPREGVGRRARR